MGSGAAITVARVRPGTDETRKGNLGRRQILERVGKRDKWLCVESYRNEREKMNLLYWQLTCMSFYNVKEWQWLLDEWGFEGDCGFIFFE